MKIIQFPGLPEQNIKIDINKDPISKMIVGPMTFTCPHCKQICKAEFESAIFRTIEFYCANCGSFFKVTNPAFKNKK